MNISAHDDEPPLIKTRHTAATLMLALARQRRWCERHAGGDQVFEKSSTILDGPPSPDKLRMARAALRSGAGAR